MNVEARSRAGVTDAVVEYVGSGLHLAASGTAGAYLGVGTLLGGGGWVFALGAPLVYGVVVAATLYLRHEPEPRDRNFVYLQDPRVKAVLQARGRLFTDGRQTVIREGNLGISGMAGLGMQGKREISQSLDASPYERYRKLEKYVRMREVAGYQALPDGFTIWKMHVQVLESAAATQEAAIYLKVRVAKANCEAWLMVWKEHVVEDERFDAPGSTLSLVGWLQARQQFPEPGLIADPSDLRLRALAMWVPRNPQDVMGEQGP